MGDIMHEGDMAEELAEREYVSLTIYELMDMARDTLREKWLQRAIESPQEVREAYKVYFIPGPEGDQI